MRCRNVQIYLLETLNSEHTQKWMLKREYRIRFRNYPENKPKTDRRV